MEKVTIQNPENPSPGGVGMQPLKDFVWNCLLQATRDNMQSIAFPAIGTGILKYPKEDVAEAMINTVHEFSDKCPTTLQSVFFVIFDDATLQEFKIRSTAKQTDAASNTQTPSVSRKVKITVVGIPDKAEAASNCLHAFIENFKKRKCIRSWRVFAIDSCENGFRN
uniref:UPF0189 protein ymdB n=1 Tax=Magallana gigas TaxID=29159 RepID=K1R5Q7_MAGGI